MRKTSQHQAVLQVNKRGHVVLRSTPSFGAPETANAYVPMPSVGFLFPFLFFSLLTPVFALSRTIRFV